MMIGKKPSILLRREREGQLKLALEHAPQVQESSAASAMYDVSEVAEGSGDTTAT